MPPRPCSPELLWDSDLLMPVLNRSDEPRLTAAFAGREPDQHHHCRRPALAPDIEWSWLTRRAMSGGASSFSHKSHWISPTIRRIAQAMTPRQLKTLGELLYGRR